MNGNAQIVPNILIPLVNYSNVAREERPQYLEAHYDEILDALGALDVWRDSALNNLPKNKLVECYIETSLPAILKLAEWLEQNA